MEMEREREKEKEMERGDKGDVNEYHDLFMLVFSIILGSSAGCTTLRRKRR
jgi:hypothetical protein